MSLRVYLILMLAATVVAWGAWLAVGYNVNPDLSGVLGIVLFYSSFAFALFGAFSLLGFLIRYIFQKDVLPIRQVINSFRQAIFYTALLIIVLFLQSQRLFTWWNIILLILALTLLEYFFLVRKQKAEGLKNLKT